MSEETPAAREVEPAATDETSENARNGARKRRDPNEPSAVVGLGASAGGIAALQQFFSGMSPESGLAFAVVMHLSPEHESNLAAVIQQKTSMPVMQVTEPVRVRPNHVYVIPPNHQLTFEEDTLRLVAPQQWPGKRVTIDLFFRTLAQAYGQRAVCAVLSGSDSDGAIGVKHIRAHGGLAIAQDPAEAEHESMPQMAIGTGMVDWVLPVAQMPAKLMEFVRNEHAMRLPPEIEDEDGADVKEKDAPGGETVSDETRSTADESALKDVLAHLHAQTGHNFKHYKRATVLRRVVRRLQVNSIETIPHYLEFLRKHPPEARALLQDMLIGVTHFFRDKESFAALAAHIPQLFGGKGKDDPLRVWVAGCSTGEEAYSVAMLLCEQAEKLQASPTVQIFASDIDEQAIQDARDGLYPSTIEADVSQERLRRFFVKDQGRYRVRKELREKVFFSAHNLLSNAPFSRVDLISCRNLLIYLNAQAQEEVFDIFHFSLRNGGLLFIGSSESRKMQGLFSPVDAKARIYVRRPVPRPTWKIPTLPLRAHEAPMQARVPGRGRTLPMLGQSTIEDAATNSHRALFTGQERRAALFGELHLKLLEQYAPPSIVVNEEHEIVHLSEKAGRYLRFTAGEPSMNLFRVINPALQIELRTALFRASRGDGVQVLSAPRTVHLDGCAEVIAMEVRGIASAPSEKYFLVLFREQSELPARPKAAEAGDVARSLDDEVAYLKEQLNATVEQSEASSEELKASNEELQAMNEELRSATEELETSKEELQSVNEELSTVNAELKNSVEDLSRANTDLNNLMASTDIGTIFLDRQLRIVRFTPSAQMVFNLLPADLGRPLGDITHELHYDGLIADAEQVLDRLAVIEREVPMDEHEVPLDGKRWFLVRIAPYRTADDRISGVVATFIDITRRRGAEEEVRASGARYRTLFELVPVAVYTTDAEGTIQEFNERATELWGRTPEKNGEKFCGSFRIYHPNGRPMPHDQCPMARVLRGEELEPADLEIVVAQENGTRRNVTVAPHALKDARGNIVGAINCLHDVTQRRQAEEALRASEERFRNVADNVPQVIWTNDANGGANYFNRRWYEYSGLSFEQSAGPGWQAIVHPDDEPASVQRWQQALKKGEVFDAEYRLRGSDGVYRWFIGRNVPLRDNGTVLSWFGSATDIHDFKEAQAKLGETEERFQLLVEGTPDYAMFLLDANNKITYWSSGAERVFGWSAQEAVGKAGDIIFTAEDKANGAVEKELQTAVEHGHAPDRRWHQRKDRSRLWADGIMRRIDHNGGSLRGFAKICRDATDQRAIEDALRQARDEMEQRVRDRTRDVLATNAELERTMAQRQELEKELLEISEREKRRIGEDLHDMVCQELTGTALFLKSNASKVETESPAARVILEEAAQIVNRNVGLARDLARGLQPAELKGSGLKQALRALAEQACEMSNVKCHFKAARGVRVTDDTIALHLYRVAQEAVKNALKHSGAKNVLISLDKNAENVCVTVEDDGKGFRPGSRSKGLGLHIMRYRANALGGHLKIARRKRGGMEIVCVIPVKR